MPGALDIEVAVEVEPGAENGAVEVEVELEWPAPGGDGTATNEDATDGASGGGAAGDATGDAIGDATGDAVKRPACPADASRSLARFEVYRDRSDEWRWRMVHRNGNVIATGGEGYTRRENALKGLRSVMRNSPDAEVHVEGER